MKGGARNKIWRGGKRMGKEEAEPRPRKVQRKGGQTMDYIMGNSQTGTETRANPRSDAATKP